MLGLPKIKTRYMLAAASLLLSSDAYASSCYPPTEYLTLELIEVTEDGGPLADPSPYHGVVGELSASQTSEHLNAEWRTPSTVRQGTLEYYDRQ